MISMTIYEVAVDDLGKGMMPRRRHGPCKGAENEARRQVSERVSRVSIGSGRKYLGLKRKQEPGPPHWNRLQKGQH